MLFVFFLYIKDVIITVLSMGEVLSSMRRIEIWCIDFNFEIITYKIILDVLYISPGFLRDTASPNFTSI
jgi:hypothetical protein